MFKIRNLEAEIILNITPEQTSKSKCRIRGLANMLKIQRLTFSIITQQTGPRTRHVESLTPKVKQDSPI